jgi:hypothetical protein
MSAAFNQAIASINALSTNERALVAHCLISSLESQHDDGVDEAWGALAANRYAELESGAVQGLSWSELKNTVTQRDA